MQSSDAICVATMRMRVYSSSCPDFDPGIHPLRNRFYRREMDHRVKPGDDERCNDFRGCLKF
ncbi:MAG: hypothetical protein E6G85_25940 [Alphaproteobacteria bacterium]|nr:MAG: hypothetical protein E6G85_25940 [Alphaproteobacteria bacterium]